MNHHTGTSVFFMSLPVRIKCPIIFKSLLLTFNLPNVYILLGQLVKIELTKTSQRLKDTLAIDLLQAPIVSIV